MGAFQKIIDDLKELDEHGCFIITAGSMEDIIEKSNRELIAIMKKYAEKPENVQFYREFKEWHKKWFK